MAIRSYTSRSEFEQYRFNPFVTVLVPFALILIQAYLPAIFPRFLILDLPLIATIFFAVSRRSPIAGTFTGAAIGLLQDALTNQPIGVNGLAKALIGYSAASIGFKVDVDSVTTRAVMSFSFFLLQSALLYLIQRRLLDMHGFQVLWLHELLRAAVNTVVAIPIFLLLDHTKIRE